MRDYFSHFYEFVMHDEEVTITPQWSTDALSRYFDPTGPYGPIIKAANLPASFVIIQRINLGLMAILGDLRATANFRGIANELWPWVDGPPVDRDGGRGRLAGHGAPSPVGLTDPQRAPGAIRTMRGGRRAGRCAGEAAPGRRLRTGSRRCEPALDDGGRAARAVGGWSQEDPLRLSKHLVTGLVVPGPGAERRPGRGR